MNRPRFRLLVAILPLAASFAQGAETPARSLEIPADTLADKIHGGLLGQLLGNLNGLTHEMKYIAEPGDVGSYTPALPDGARTDDDTDLEWVYVVAMQREATIFLPPKQITTLWKTHVNRSIWCANEYARQLMDLGIDPPLTGHAALNPWSDFNLSGQFVCESFGLMAPGMPQTAARIGLHYTHVTIDGEPAQTTQLFTAMIATAFVTDEMGKILDAGVAAVDPRSEVRRIVDQVRGWHRRHPHDWRATRRLAKQTYSRHGGAMRDRNGYELNTASTIAALLYGQGDFVETLRIAFCFGWDADNNAATAGTILGVIKGRRWMTAQGWDIGDVYRNTTRPGMPDDETITRFGDRLLGLAQRVILQRGGNKTRVNGRTVYRVCRQSPGNVERLRDAAGQFARLQDRMKPPIEAAVAGDATPQQQARAAYMAICLDLAEPLRQRDPDRWSRSTAALSRYPKLLQVLKKSPTPAAAKLRARAAAAGVDY